MCDALTPMAGRPIAGAATDAARTPTVVIIDDDDSVRESLELLIGAAGWRVEAFPSAHAFLGRPLPPAPCCLVLDLEMPGLGGLDLQRQLVAGRTGIPIVFISGHRDVAKTVQAMKDGAVEFLTKPLNASRLLTAIATALERSHAAWSQQLRLQPLRDRYARLTNRERQVLELVVCGRMNRQIGAEIGISEPMVKSHRTNLMRKLGATSVPDLVNFAVQLGLEIRL